MRANWKTRQCSDLELILMTDTPLDVSRYSDLLEAFSQSDLPYQVDIVEWTGIDERGQEIVQSNGVTVQEAGRPPTRSSVDAAKWTTTKLGQLLSFTNGKSSPMRSDRFPYRVYGSNGVIGFSEEANADPNTIVVGRVGANCGSLHYSDSACWVTDNAIRATAVGENDAQFLFYLLRTLQLNKRRAGSGQPLLNQAVLSSISTKVPPIPEQRTLAHILGSLDAKIKLNRRKNATLEAMAQALFKSWFVDFDPVRAKMEGRDTGLPKQIADLFPDWLVESEMGEIPWGWKAFRLDRIAAHHTNSTSPLRFPEKEFEHFSIPAYDAGQRPSIELGAAIRSNKTIVHKDAVLLSKLNPRIPRIWMPADSKRRPQVCSTEFLVFTPRPPANRSLLFSLFADQSFRAQLKSIVTGTSKSHQRVPPNALKAQKVLAGSSRVFQMYDEVVGSMLAGVLKNRSEATILAAFRDTLLPRLFSGEICLPTAGTAMEAQI